MICDSEMEGGKGFSQESGSMRSDIHSSELEHLRSAGASPHDLSAKASKGLSDKETSAGILNGSSDKPLCTPL